MKLEGQGGRGMKVTNEQAEAIRDLSCAVYIDSDKNKLGFWTEKVLVGIAYEKNGNEKKIYSCDLAADLLEARELIKEMREAVGNLLDGKNRVFECSCEAEDFDELEAKTGKAYLLWERLKMAFERSKEYAE